MARLRFALFLAIVSWSSPGWASPWTLPDDELLLAVSYDFQFADHEFLPDGSYQRLPLEGRFVSNTLRLGARYGFTDRLELGAEANFKQATFTAQPVLLALPDDNDDLRAVRSELKNFSRTEIGAADVWFTGRYNFYRGVVVLTNETRLKLPTGYPGPEGTFDPETFEVADDLALGDAQTDLEDSLLLGFFVPPTRTFGRIDAGFRLRFGGPGHQVIGSIKAGQFLGEHFILFAGAGGAYTVTEGEIIGQTFVSTEPDGLDTVDVVPGENTIPVDLRYDKDWLNVEAGLIFVPVRGVELQLAAARTVIGTNITATNALFVSTAVRMQELTADEDAE